MSTAIAIRESMNIAARIQSGDLETVTLNKRGKQGDLNALMAFGSRDARIAMSQGLMLKQIENSQFRPFVRNLTSAKLLSDEVMGLIGYKLGTSGPIKAEVMEDFCQQALHALNAKLAKTGKSVKDLKGEKLFYANILRFIVGDMEDIVVEA